jgi:hypothetical protein
VALLASAALAVVSRPAGGAVAVANGSCTITQTHSIVGQVRTNIEFVNRTAGTVKVYWLDYSGKRVYYSTLKADTSYVQATWATHPWVVLDSAGVCVGYVIAPHALYVIGGGAQASGGQSAPSARAAMPHWIYQMINDFNLGISQPGGAVASSLLLHRECATAPPNWAFVDSNLALLTSVIDRSFVPYTKLPASWLTQIGTLKPSAATALARAKLKAAQPLHAQEVSAWQKAVVAIKAHDCAGFLDDVRAAARVGGPDWADQYAAVKALAGLYGQAGSASHQTPYGQTIG